MNVTALPIILAQNIASLAKKQEADSTTTTTSPTNALTNTSNTVTTEASPLEKLASFIESLTEHQKETFCQRIIEADVSKADTTPISEIVDILDTKDIDTYGSYYANIKQFCQEQGAILGAITQHGNIVNAYANLADALREALSKGLEALSPKQEKEIGTEAYQKELITFKESIAHAINKYNLALNASKGHPGAQKILAQKAQQNLLEELSTILKNVDKKFRKEDINSLLKDLKETTAKTDKDPVAKRSLKDLTTMFYSKEGLVMATMLIPTLGQLISGTLGQLPIVGGLIKQISGLVAGLGAISQQFIPIYTMFQQQATKRAVEGITVAKKEIPPVKKEPNETHLAQAA